MVLTNYRGIAHREIEFPDRGVVVVSGANEIGKTSMIEALDLLLEAKDRSTKKEVKQVKPTHADVGAEVSAEISTGSYRFVYRKRFHKRAETQLTLLAPRREELSGDEAHDRVAAILAETVDVDLWRAQRVLQTATTAAVDLSGSDALARALDVAAGQAAESADPLLVDRIDAEYRRYFTLTGRPTGEWAAAVKQLADADAEVARCAAAVAEVDDAVRTHAELCARLAETDGARAESAQRVLRARAAADTAAELTRRLTEATAVAAAATARHDAAVAALTGRRRLRADIDERAAALPAAEAALVTAAASAVSAQERHETAEAAAATARLLVQSCQVRVDEARAAVDRLARREEADRLALRLAKIDAARRELIRGETELAAGSLTDTMMQAVEEAAAGCDRAAAQLDAVSARIELSATADVAVEVDGTPVLLAAGQQWSATATTCTEIGIAGLLTARIVGGAPAAESQARLEAAQQVLSGLLVAAGAADLAAARVLDRRRRELLIEQGRLSAVIEALLSDDILGDLRVRLAELTAGQSADGGLFDLDGPVDLAAARAGFEAESRAHRQAQLDAETHRKAAAESGRWVAACTAAAGVAREKLAAARGELELAQNRLNTERQRAGDDALALAAQTHGDEAHTAAGQVAVVRAELADLDPDAVAVESDAAERESDSLQIQHSDTIGALRDVAARLTVYGTEGRQGRLDAAQSLHQRAEAEHRRVHRRAEAAQLLRAVVTRHRDATRARYIEPFRGEVQRLGRLVFGDTFEVEVDTALQICSRTLAGRTVPYESLSGGAREQLGIVARLACSALVSKEDGVPVVIDDALGFTDPERLVKMGAVFDAVAGDSQVIVLTCSPDRYAGIGDAHHLELTT